MDRAHRGAARDAAPAGPHERRRDGRRLGDDRRRLQGPGRAASAPRRGVAERSVQRPRGARRLDRHADPDRERGQSTGRHPGRPGARWPGTRACLPSHRHRPVPAVRIHRRGLARAGDHAERRPGGCGSGPAHADGVRRRGPRARRRERDLHPRVGRAVRTARPQPHRPAEGEPHAGRPGPRLQARARPLIEPGLLRIVRGARRPARISPSTRASRTCTSPARRQRSTPSSGAVLR